MAHKTLSVVITSYDPRRLPDIYTLLAAIKAQTYPDIETIFVAESAELYEKVAAAAAGNGRTRVASNDGEPGLSPSRNIGIGLATGDIIAFIDDDALPFPDWAAEMVRTYEDGSVIGATGAAIPLWDGRDHSWFPEELSWIIGGTAWSEGGKRAVRNAWGMNMSFRREAFEIAGLFAPAFGLRDRTRQRAWADPPSEDVDLSLRVRAKTGKQIVFNPLAKVRHRVSGRKMGAGFIVRRAFSVGCQRRMLKALYPVSGTGDLGEERELLGRIMMKLVPGAAGGLLRSPGLACRRLSVTAAVLFFVAIGYLSPLPRPPRAKGGT